MPRDLREFEKGLIGPVREWHVPDLTSTDEDYSDHPPVGFHVRTTGTLNIRTPGRPDDTLTYVAAQIPVGAFIYPVQIAMVERTGTTAEIVVWW